MTETRQQLRRSSRNYRVEISSLSLLGMELIYRSERLENRLLKDLAAVAALPNLKYAPLTPDVAVPDLYLRQTLDAAFFDFAATALDHDRGIISFDRSYDKVHGLIRLDPTSFRLRRP